MVKHSTVDEYINAQPKDIAKRLQAIRALFHKILPHTEGTKDALHFKHTEPLPLKLIREIIIANEAKKS